MTSTDRASSRAPATDAWLVAIGAVVATIVIARIAPAAENDDPTVEVVAQLLLALAVGAGAFVVARRFSPTLTGALVALLTGLFLCGGATVLLNATPFGPLGAVADQGYRTAYLTKFAHSWGLVDYAYKDLPSFYPPLYFWVLGRLSAVLGIAPWHMLKIGTLSVAFLVPTVGWLLWRPIAGPRRAAAIVVVTSLAFQEWYVPHLWLAIAVFVPWWLWFVLGVGRPPERRLGRGGLAAGIAIGAVIALTYWYVLVIGLLQLVGLLATRRLLRRRGWTPEPPSVRDVAMLLGGVVVVTSVYWVPLVVRVLTTPGAKTMQNRFFTPDEVSLPSPFLTFDLEGLVLLGGLVALAATAHRRRLSLHLLGLLAAAYGLYLLGYLGFLVDNPLDTVRTHGFIEFVLAAGAAIGATDLWRSVAGLRDTRVDPAAARGVLAVGALVAVFALGQHSVRDIPYLTEQRDAEYPEALLLDFARATGHRYENAVVLTDVTDLSSFLPTYVFNTTNAHYSHPAALFDDRADLLTRLSGEDDADVFALAFLHNRYDRIDLVALRPVTNGLGYSWLGDAFPSGVSQEAITFPEWQFASDAFDRLRSSELAMYRVDRRHDPLRQLRQCPEQPDRSRCQVLAPLLARYAQHLDDEARDLATRWQQAR